jgi:hypothetical protein
MMTLDGKRERVQRGEFGYTAHSPSPLITW